MNFNRNAPNSHVPAINFLEFLVHALSITSHYPQLADSESSKHACKSYSVAAESSLS